MFLSLFLFPFFWDIRVLGDKHVLSSDPTRCTILKRTYSLTAMMTAMAAENPAFTLMIVPTAELCLLRSSPFRLGSKIVGKLPDEVAISKGNRATQG